MYVQFTFSSSVYISSFVAWKGIASEHQRVDIVDNRPELCFKHLYLYWRYDLSFHFDFSHIYNGATMFLQLPFLIFKHQNANDILVIVLIVQATVLYLVTSPYNMLCYRSLFSLRHAYCITFSSRILFLTLSEGHHYTLVSFIRQVYTVKSRAILHRRSWVITKSFITVIMRCFTNPSYIHEILVLSY